MKKVQPLLLGNTLMQRREKEPSSANAMHRLPGRQKHSVLWEQTGRLPRDPCR